MTRQIAKTVILAKLEPSYGTIDPGGLAAADAVLISNAKFRIPRDVVPRELLRGYLGGSEHLIGTRRAEIEFDVELAGSGTAGTAPEWGKLLRACGMAEAITAANRVEYTPVSGGFESLTFLYHLDGIRYQSRGARGTVQFMMNAYERPMMRFKFTGFDTLAIEGAVPNAVFAGWQRPQVITDENAGDIRLGGTYAAGVVSGGTVLQSRGLTVDLGNTVSHLKILGGEAIDITQRETSGTIAVFLTAANEVTWRNELNVNTLTSLGFNFGTVAGNRIAVFMPSVQRLTPDPEDYEGRAMMSGEIRVLPTSAGNDELRIVAR